MGHNSLYLELKATKIQLKVFIIGSSYSIIYLKSSFISDVYCVNSIKSTNGKQNLTFNVFFFSTYFIFPIMVDLLVNPTSQFALNLSSYFGMLFTRKTI